MHQRVYFQSGGIQYKLCNRVADDNNTERVSSLLFHGKMSN